MIRAAQLSEVCVRAPQTPSLSLSLASSVSSKSVEAIQVSAHSSQKNKSVRTQLVNLSGHIHLRVTTVA
jgi:hypothetical protein